MMNKKAALELSITAIVVLIIAITVLGLGIGFIKNLFQEGTETIGEQFEAIKERLREEFLAQGVIVGFSAGTDIQVDFGKRKEFYLGVRNTESTERCFAVDVKCKRPFAGDTCGRAQMEESVLPYWFPTFPPDVEIEGNDIYVAPVILHITDAEKGTYRLALDLYKADDCAQIDTTSPEQRVDSTLIHITVN